MNKTVKKVAGKKFVPTATKQTKVETATVKSDSMNIKNIVFFIVIALVYFVFIAGFFSNPDFTNKFIKLKASWIINIQVLIYTLLTGLFAYFGYLFINNKTPKNTKLQYLLAFLGFSMIVSVQMLAFNPAMEDVDDNAAYMIGAKSIVEKGDLYYLYLPEIKPDTDLPWGLPLMLAPIYKYSGMNYQYMEYMIFATLLGSLIFMFLLFRKLAGFNFAVLITILFGIHPYIVMFSSIIMTEIPYILWSLLALFLVYKYEEKEKINYWYLLGAGLAIFMTYLTRAVGSGFVIAVFFYFLIKSDLHKYIMKKDFRFYKDIKFKKFFAIALIMFLLMLAWQIKAKLSGGASQAEAFSKINVGAVFKLNVEAVWQTFSQMVFAGGTVTKGLQPFSMWMFVVLAFAFIGMIYDLIKKGLLSLYTIFVLLILMIGNVSTQPPVVLRYLIIFVPFFIYFFYLGIKTTVDLILRKQNLGPVVGLMCLGLVLVNSFEGSANDIQKSHTGQMYSVPFSSFLECAKWAKENLPKDAIVTSRKERIFFVFSGLRGFKHTGYRDVYSEEFETKKLKEFADKNTDYLILDTFNGSTIANILPIVEHNPDKFKMIKMIGDQQEGPCYVFQLNKWWTNK